MKKTGGSSHVAGRRWVRVSSRLSRPVNRAVHGWCDIVLALGGEVEVTGGGEGEVGFLVKAG